MIVFTAITKELDLFCYIESGTYNITDNGKLSDVMGGHRISELNPNDLIVAGWKLLGSPIRIKIMGYDHYRWFFSRDEDEKKTYP